MENGHAATSRGLWPLLRRRVVLHCDALAKRVDASRLALPN